MQPSPIILIPARYESTRFPGKPLASISGQAMIDHVFDRCEATGWTTAVVTDDDRIEKHLIKGKRNVVRVDDDVPSGSERIALAFERFFSKETYSAIINVQGDEPKITSELLSSLNGFHQSHDFGISTLVRERSDQDGYKNSNIVKALWCEKTGEVLSFSRASIPFYRNEMALRWWQHIGVYCYEPQALTEFVGLKPSFIERAESLEQMRAMENGLKIGALITDQQLVGVDTPEDIKLIEESVE